MIRNSDNKFVKKIQTYCRKIDLFRKKNCIFSGGYPFVFNESQDTQIVYMCPQIQQHV